MTQITLRNIQRSTALHDRIRQLREHLERYHPNILTCRVSLEETGKRHEQGKQYEVAVTVHIPGQQIVVTRNHDEDVYLALRDAFDVVRRQLLDASGMRVGRPRSRKRKQKEEVQ